MGSSLSIRNDENGPVRAELYAKTGTLLQAAHIPEGSLFSHISPHLIMNEVIKAWFPYRSSLGADKQKIDSDDALRFNSNR